MYTILIFKHWLLIVIMGLLITSCTGSTDGLGSEGGFVFTGDSYYISPNGSDSNDGKSQASPWKTFKYALDLSTGITQGDELVLLDGDYTESTTGILREVGNNGAPLPNDNSSAIPSGLSRLKPTIVRAASPGKVKIIGPTGIQPLFMGRSTRKDSFIHVRDITFIGGGMLYNTSYVIVKDSGFKGAFSVGTNDHYDGNDFNLIEDVWIWAENRRIIAMNYRSHNNVWRRVLVRSEGCDLAGCEGAPKADPSVGITVYDSQNISMQNIIVIDRLIRNDSPYADFATAQHTSATDADGNGADYFLSNNKWLGSMSVNSQDASLLFEGDYVKAGSDPIWTIDHFISVGSSATGINIGNTPFNYVAAGSPPSYIKNSTAIIFSNPADVSGIRFNPQHTGGVVSNTVSVGATRTGFNVLGGTVNSSANYSLSTTDGDFDAGTCTKCISLNADPTTNGSFRYPVRVESGSAVATAISNTDIGANVTNQYGVSGTIFNDPGYDSISTASLWPWPNEDRIKQEMCIDEGITRGFCSTDFQRNGTSKITVTSYIWELLGNAIPSGIY